MKLEINRDNKNGIYKCRLRQKSLSWFSESTFRAIINGIVAHIEKDPNNILLEFQHIGSLPTIALNYISKLINITKNANRIIAFVNPPENIRNTLLAIEKKYTTPPFFIASSNKDALLKFSEMN